MQKIDFETFIPGFWLHRWNYLEAFRSTMKKSEGESNSTPITRKKNLKDTWTKSGPILKLKQEEGYFYNIHPFNNKKNKK